MTSDATVLVEERERVMVLTLNRPEARNALSSGLLDALLQALHDLDANPGLSVGVIAGAGPTFCAGMDMKEFARSGPPRRLDELLHRTAVKPLVAAVEGAALGGGLEVALLCDLIVSSTTATFGLPEPKRGLFAAGGGLLRLPRRLPHGVAMEMILTGSSISAEEANQGGLVARLAEPGLALAAAVELAERIALNAPMAVVASRRLASLTVADDAEFWAEQRTHLRTVFRSADATEGARAFAEKREPRWVGT